MRNRNENKGVVKSEATFQHFVAAFYNINLEIETLSIFETLIPVAGLEEAASDGGNCSQNNREQYI